MTLTAVLLVGGLSQRMGVDKATLDVAGTPLWTRQLRLLRELAPQRILLSARARPSWCPSEMAIVLDASPARGPLSGLAAALRHLETSHLLALAIDLPRMNVAVLQKLVAHAELGCGIIPMTGEHLEPLCAIYPAESATAAAAALTGEDVSLHHFARGLMRTNCLKTYVVPDSERPLFLNANSPVDLQQL